MWKRKIRFSENTVIFPVVKENQNDKRKPKNWFEGHSEKPLLYLWFISDFGADFISIMNCCQNLVFGLAYFLPLGIYSCCPKERFTNEYLKKIKW